MEAARTLLIRLQRPKEAARIAQKLFEKNPMNGELVGLLVNAYEFSGEIDKAVAVLDTWLKERPNDKSAMQMKKSLERRLKK